MRLVEDIPLMEHFETHDGRVFPTAGSFFEKPVHRGFQNVP